MTTRPMPPAPSPSALASLDQSWRSVAAWFDVHGGDIGLAAAAGAALFALLSGLRWLARRREIRLDPDISLSDIILRAVARTKTLTIAVLSACAVAPYISPSTAVLGVMAVALTAALALQGAAWARDILLGFIQRRAAENGNETLVNAMAIIRLLISVTVFTIAAIIILDNIGVNVSGLLAGLGIGGIAIGLAAQGIFSDLFAALSIIFDRPFRNGETIRYDTTIATVERIGLKSTRLRSVNGEQLIISNTNLLGKEIANFARLERRRVTFRLGLVCQTSPAAMRALPGVMQAVVETAGHGFIRAGFLAFGASSLDFELVFDVMTEDLEVVAAARTEVGIALFETMLAADYTLAYPTQTTFTAAPDGRMIMPFFDPTPPG